MDFRPSQAALRIRRVQLLCKQHDLDGVLLVPGVDGRFSVCNQAMGYLFEGRSNRDTIDVSKLGGQLDDAVALITPGDVCLYSPSKELHAQLTQLLLPYVPSLRIIGPTSAEVADADLLEENKLGTLVHMLRGLKRLGIPCGLAPCEDSGAGGAAANAAANGGSPQSGLPRLGSDALLALERWPLLQAYGLEGVGRGGFFTMNFEVYDVLPALDRLYGSLDGRSLGVVLGEALPALRLHWDEMLQALGGRPAGQRGSLTERQVAEPLAGYFAYGLLRPAEGVEQAVTLPPRVVFGPRSSDDAAPSGADRLVDCGPPGGGPPLHFVAEAADPRGPLRVARTYFLAAGAAERNVFADPDEEAEEGYSWEAATRGWAQGSLPDLLQLMRTYVAMAEAARAAMAAFASGVSAAGAKAAAQGVLARRAEQLGAAGGGGAGGASLASRLRFSLFQVDHANRVTALAVHGSRQLKVLRLSLPDIVCTSGPAAGKSLGGLVYGDTFIDLPTEQHQQQPAAASGGGEAGTCVPLGAPQLLVLTEGIPVVAAVPAGGPEEDLARRALRSLLKALGGGAGAARGGGRVASAASQRDAGRRAAAGAAAESAAMAARLRARRDGLAEAAREDEGGEDGIVEDADDGLGDEAAAAAPELPSAPLPAEALGQLLSVGGGEDAVLLTGAAALPSLSGTLYCFAAGLAFVERTSRAVWSLDLRQPGGLEAVTLQHLHLHLMDATLTPAGRADGPAPPSGAPSSDGDPSPSADLGEAVVFRGTAPACGLAPPCHLTPNKHLALPLAAMPPASRRFLLGTVLPAWQQTLREAEAAAVQRPAAGGSGGGFVATYLKDAAAANPFPPALQRCHVAAVQSFQGMGGPAKSWPAGAGAGAGGEADAEAALQRLDGHELQGALSGLDPQVESLLLLPPPRATQTPGDGLPAPARVDITLVAGLPGCEQAAVGAAVASMAEGPGAAAQVAMLPLAPGPLRPQDFAAALSAAANVRHLVLATSSYLGLYDQLRMLAYAIAQNGGVGSGRWRLACVVVTLSADVAFEEPGRGALAGGALAQLVPGCVDCVVLGGGDAAKVSELSSLVSSRLPGVPLVRSGRQQLMRAREELMPAQAERSARLAAPRALAARGWGPLCGAGGRPSGGSCGGGGLLGPLHATRVAFEGALDLAKLREALRLLGAPQDPAAAPPLPLRDTDSAPAAAVPGLVCVTGCVRLPAGTAGGRTSEVVASRGAPLRSREWPLEGRAVTGGCQLPADERAPGGELTFVGAGTAVSEQALRALLERCSEGGGSGGDSTSASAAVNSVSLTPAQRSAIRSAHLHDPLPEGYCFNGTQYFDAFGDASMEHPHMDRFIQEWRAEQAASAAAAEAASTGARGSVVTVTRVQGPVRL